jgi:inward rectifier potassium channel
MRDRRAKKETQPSTAHRRDVSEAVRKGAPSELRRDLYFFFMEGSWTRMIVSLLFMYVMVNVLFAGLYLLEPASIGVQSADAFGPAFAFSVQTMSTIGYGAMSPQTPYGDLIVTIEAAVGLLGVALATGLMFAKASRPRASVLFSNNILVNTMDGRRVLTFRVGNARGNEVVEASISVSVLRDHISPEGHSIRKVIDLPLERSRTPVFALSWVVFHVIDDESPLRDVDFGTCEGVFGFVVTMMGHDATYGMTTHARKTYWPEEVLVNHRFVDVLSQLADGRLMIDYAKFHDTEAESSATESS